MSDAVRRIPLDRRVLVVREQRIDLRPERGAVLFPLIGLAIALTLFAIVVLFANSLPAGLLLLILIPGLVLAPFSGMGLVYSVIGASVVVEKKKHSVRFQQGVLGLGIGTMELVPFWKIEHIAVEDFALGDITRTSRSSTCAPGTSCSSRRAASGCRWARSSLRIRRT